MIMEIPKNIILTSKQVKKDHGPTGHLTSYSFKDVPEQERYKHLKQYLESGYKEGNDFIFTIREFSNNIYEKEKISGKLNIKNATVCEPRTAKSKELTDKQHALRPDWEERTILGAGSETGETYNIKKESEFSKDYDLAYAARLASSEKVQEIYGTLYHRVLISRQFIKECLGQLKENHQILINYWINPAKKYSDDDQKIISKIKNLSYKNRSDKLKKSIRALILILIDETT